MTDGPMIERELHTVKDDNENTEAGPTEVGYPENTLADPIETGYPENGGLTPEQDTRCNALYHAGAILKQRVSQGPWKGMVEQHGKADDLLALAEYIVKGDLWFDDPEKGKEPADE